MVTHFEKKFVETTGDKKNYLIVIPFEDGNVVERVNGFVTKKEEIINWKRTIRWW